MTRPRPQLELRWYSDWRWRVSGDRAGLVLWFGPLAVLWWRQPDHGRIIPR